MGLLGKIVTADKNSDDKSQDPIENVFKTIFNPLGNVDMSNIAKSSEKLFQHHTKDGKKIYKGEGFIFW